MGRVSQYDPALCDEVTAFMAQGLSLTAWRGEKGFARQTVLDWQKRHPDFAEAVDIGKARRTGFHERRLLTAETGPEVTSIIYTLKNADPEEWNNDNRQSITVSNPDGSKLEISDREFVQRIALLLNRAALDPMAAASVTSKQATH